MSDLIHKVVLTCHQATAAIEKKEDNSLSLIGRAQLRLHLLICKACRQYERQSQRISRMLQQRFATPASEAAEKPSDSGLHERILRRFSNRPGDKDA